MLKNYFTTALRYLRRRPGYAFINVTSLAIGLACCLLIGLFVREEWRYDQHHPHADRIHRILSERENIVSSWADASTAPVLLADYPEVQQATRISPPPGPVLLRYGDKRFNESRFFYADASIFNLFSVPLEKGHPATALSAPYSLVLTKEMARKYFGEREPVGETVTFNDGQGDQTFTVTGVVGDLPGPSHFRFDFLASFATFGDEVGAEHRWRGNGWTYLRIAEGADPTALMEKYMASLGPEEERASFFRNVRFVLQPVTEIHLHSHHEGEIAPNSNARYVYLFALIALLTLGVACINYMNLATARGSLRAREIGVRKVVGAHRWQLVRQFLGESVLLALLAFAIALIAAELALPFFNSLMQQQLPPVRTMPLLPLLGLVLLVGVLAGGYPAFVLSSFRPVAVLKGPFVKAGRGALLRKWLVAAQLTVSLLLLIATLVVQRQLSYLQQKHLGLNEAQVLVIPVPDGTLNERADAFKTSLQQHPAVHAVSGSYNTIGDMVGPQTVNYEINGRDIGFHMISVDFDFTETLQIPLLAGRSFSRNFPTDEADAILLNRAAADAIGWDDPVGRRIPWDREKQKTVIGVVDDFHYASLHEKIQPAYLVLWPMLVNTYFVRFDANEVPAALAHVEQVWKQFAPYRPLEYSFLDDDFDALYRSEQRLAQLFGSFALLAMGIACLGLFGLAAFAAEQRSKEISIRKVFGASVPGLIGLLTREFTRLVLVAFVVAAPLSYLAMSRWLDAFAYRIVLSPDLFLIAGLATLLVALLTVSTQAWKTASSNPVKVLRYE